MKVSRKERERIRLNVYNNIINHIKGKKEYTKINNLYRLFGMNYFSSKQYFVRSFIDIAKQDSRVKLSAMKREGTFAKLKEDNTTQIVYEIPQITSQNNSKKRLPDHRHITMKVNFGKTTLNFTGQPVNIEINEETWKKCQSVPKMISEFYNDTIELYRRDFDNNYSQYLQVTEKKQYLFVID